MLAGRPWVTLNRPVDQGLLHANALREGIRRLARALRAVHRRDRLTATDMGFLARAVAPGRLSA